MSSHNSGERNQVLLPVVQDKDKASLDLDAARENEEEKKEMSRLDTCVSVLHLGYAIQ